MKAVRICKSSCMQYIRYIFLGAQFVLFNCDVVQIPHFLYCWGYIEMCGFFSKRYEFIADKSVLNVRNANCSAFSDPM